LESFWCVFISDCIYFDLQAHHEEHESGQVTNRSRFFNIISRFPKQTIFVLGDLMLDEWIWGKVRRISPEAPVPVVEVEERTFTPGGASNVAANVRALGARVFLAGKVGTDPPATILRRKLREAGVKLDGLIAVKAKPTTLKTRIIAHNQQVVRADVEDKSRLNGKIEKKAYFLVQNLLHQADLILFSDYNKGFLASLDIQSLIQKAIQEKKKVVAAPKPQNVHLFAGSHLVVLNQGEAELAVGFDIQNVNSLEKAGKILLDRLNLQALIITRGEHGMALFEPKRPMLSIPSKASQVYDVSGAGDTVVAVAALTLSAGGSYQEAALLSNHAAGVVVRKVGTATLSVEELKETFAE
jgi:rfaE bifunctional protein kinase chain/domain